VSRKVPAKQELMETPQRPLIGVEGVEGGAGGGRVEGGRAGGV